MTAVLLLGAIIVQITNKDGTQITVRAPAGARIDVTGAEVTQVKIAQDAEHQPGTSPVPRVRQRNTPEARSVPAADVSSAAPHAELVPVTRPTDIDGVPVPAVSKPLSPPPGWQVYHLKKGGYTVWFPGMPAKSQTDVETDSGKREMTQVTLADTTSGLTFAVTSSEFADRIFPDADQVLDAARDGALQNTKGELRNEIPIKLGMYPGRELRFSIPSAPGILFRMRLYLVGQRNYQLLVAGPEKGCEGPAAQSFLQSFQLDRQQ